MGENTLATLAFVLAFVFGVALPALRRYRQRRRLARIAAQPPQVPARGSVPRTLAAAPPRPARAAPRPVALPQAAVVPRRSARWPVAGLRDARRGVVMMVVLGPCRALEPPDRDA